MCLAIPGKLLAKTEKDGMRCGRMEFGGIVRTACLDLLPEANVGGLSPRACRLRHQQHR